MAKKKDAESTLQDTAAVLGSQAKQVIDTLAKSLGVAATELWIIFVRQYVVRGANELFTAVIFYVAAVILWGIIGLWALIPLVIGIGFTYGAISYLGNPKYYALNDIVKRIKKFKEDNDKVEIRY